jgi:murein DD-endopeptidase MepM/ murein hydrolase activator NlpD
VKAQPTQTRKPRWSPSLLEWLARLLWGVAIIMVAVMVFLLVQRPPAGLAANTGEQGAPLVIATLEGEVDLPEFNPPLESSGIVRSLDTHTVLPLDIRPEIQEYTVQKGDSIFGIAGEFKLKPETILWANYETLNDDPHSISPGIDLKIPKVDGVLYQWLEGDTLDKIAEKYKVDVEAIVLYPGNKLDMTNPQVKTGEYVMLPGGQREFKQWLVPTIWKANSGANRSVAGGCNIPDGGAVGTGSFVWPAGNHYLSGNDYWSGHLGIDIAAGTGAPIYATDSGVVVYAAGIGGGYGNMVMIDHGNGYHSLYAHLSGFNVVCGQSIYQGQTIGFAGSTGRSTGPHLHFEIRFQGGFMNPWFVLP